MLMGGRDVGSVLEGGQELGNNAGFALQGIRGSFKNIFLKEPLIPCKAKPALFPSSCPPSRTDPTSRPPISISLLLLSLQGTFTKFV